MKIASLEDEPAQARLVESLLSDAGHDCITFDKGRALMAAMQKSQPFELLLLDWEIPDTSGLEVVRWVRLRYGYGLPVIFITNRTQEADIVMGLKAGADDYMSKPVRQAELYARIAALQRRHVPEPVDDGEFACGRYHVHPARLAIEFDHEEIVLAPKEFELATLFFRNPGRLFSRDVLSATVWNRDIPATSRTLDTHISNVRQKLRIGPENGMRLTSSYALGYRLELLGPVKD